MGADYKPGTVAVATVVGIEGVRVWRLNSAAWVTSEIVDGSKVHGDSKVTDVRPLVVLDVAPEKLRQFVAWIREDTAASPGAGWIEVVCSQIEAQTKPRVAEPQGLGAVVEGREGNRWVRTNESSGFPWRKVGSVDRVSAWTDITSAYEPVAVLSEGVTS